jgi:hypothetical protein
MLLVRRSERERMRTFTGGAADFTGEDGTPRAGVAVEEIAAVGAEDERCDGGHGTGCRM